MRKILMAMTAALALSGCATVQRLDAANDVHALLISIRDNDQAAFDAHVDRPALKQELQQQVVAKAVKHDRSGLAAMFAPAIADFAGDALLQPAVFKLVAQQYGYSSDTAIPNSLELATVLKPLPDGRVCATKKKSGDCQLFFTKEDGSWKLSSFSADAALTKLKTPKF